MEIGRQAVRFRGRDTARSQMLRADLSEQEETESEVIIRLNKRRPESGSSRRKFKRSSEGLNVK